MLAHIVLFVKLFLKNFSFLFVAAFFSRHFMSLVLLWMHFKVEKKQAKC